ncbi:hypothetical protein ABH935_003999 [Catenulispora sp. GAS73]|uniref:hypothetical protein n=1 Tax=Catenulispora sp. GAS73 TaxID=3156269 RepID=UPI0035147FA6
MKALNRIALLAGGALIAAAATGCSSSTSKPVASAPAATDASTTASGTPGAATTAASGGTTTPATDASTGSASSSPSATAATGSSTDHGGTPAVCDNAKLNATLAPAGAGQKASVHVIAVKNTGPACDIDYLPFVWITAGQNSSPPQAQPLIENGLGGGPHIIAPGQTLYSGIDLDPQSASNAVPGYTYLEVTANPTKDSSGKDVQDLKLPAPAKVAGAKLGTYNADEATAIKQIAFASVPQQSQH